MAIRPRLTKRSGGNSNETEKLEDNRAIGAGLQLCLCPIVWLRVRYLYCNYEILQNAFGAPFAEWEGADNLILCGSSYNADIGGISGGLLASGNPVGFAVKGVIYADDIYDAFSQAYVGAQWFVVTSLKCAKLKNGRYSGKYGWIGFAVTENILFGVNYGYLSCQLPGQPGSPPYKGPTIGTAGVPRRR